MLRWSLFARLAALSLSAVSCARSLPVPEAPTAPVAEFPEVIELGQRERGEIATARFVVANRGGAELVLDEFRSNCSCSGIEKKVGDEYLRVDAVRLRPGEQIELQMRVSVRGVPVGAQARNGVTFRTNVPDQPAGRIEAVIDRVTGGVFTVPETVIVGRVPIGTAVQHVFEVFDDAVTPRTLERVASSQKCVQVRILGPAEGPRVKTARGTRIARVEVTVDTTAPESIDCALSLHLAGSHQVPDQIRVLGTVEAPVTASPATLVLPRSSPEGPIYSAKCLLRSNDGKPLTVVLDSCPPHLKVTIPQAEQPAPLVAVSVALDVSVVSKDRDKPVRLRCRTGEDEVIVELRVITAPTP